MLTSRLRLRFFPVAKFITWISNGVPINDKLNSGKTIITSHKTEPDDRRGGKKMTEANNWPRVSPNEQLKKNCRQLRAFIMKWRASMMILMRLIESSRWKDKQHGRALSWLLMSVGDKNPLNGFPLALIIGSRTQTWGYKGSMPILDREWETIRKLTLY